MTDQVEKKDVTYEESDVNIRGIVKFGLGLSVAIVVA